MMRNRIRFGSIACGLLFLAAGMLLVGFNTGYVPERYMHILFSFPMLIIAIGFIIFCSRHYTAGIVFMIVGSVFLLPRLHFAGLDFLIKNAWAVGFMILGVFIISMAFTGLRKRHAGSAGHRSGSTEHVHIHGSETRKERGGFIERSSVFSGSKEKLDIKNFCGGTVSSVFGGMELDLSEAQMAEGTHYLELNSVFGGVVIIVPATWNVEIHQHHVFGRFVDKRPHANVTPDAKSMLVIEANDVFGGGEIRCRQHFDVRG